MVLSISFQCTIQNNRSPTKTYYSVDTSRCIGCGICVDSCRFNAIRLDTITWKAQIDSTVCTSCGTCKRVCQHQAIKDTTY
ncbi:MAG: 4Fe-4S binding protein [candidate division WOR-3 bacterium]|nr:4Fe-4S binding protein [candidate division WOR-3 bacterium]